MVPVRTCWTNPCRRGPLPAPSVNPTDYWATRSWVSRAVRTALVPFETALSALERRVGEIEAGTLPDDEFRKIASRVGVAFRTDLPSLGGEEIALHRNDDLYVALAKVIVALGGRPVI